MDFIFALIHFCEIHGPASILSSSMLISSCDECNSECQSDAVSLSSSTASNPADSQANNASHKPPDGAFVARESCQSCRPTIPSVVTSQEQSGSAAPGDSPRGPGCQGNNHQDETVTSNQPCQSDISHYQAKGHGRSDQPQSHTQRIVDHNPVLRTSESVFFCPDIVAHQNHSTPAYRNRNNSFDSDSASASSAASAQPKCHQHTAYYLSKRVPSSPDAYAKLRHTCIRTLSCEVLPRGQSSGPLSFVDNKVGHIIAYHFRVPDVMARGRMLQYAFVVLAGHDDRRAACATPIIWRTFGRLANDIVSRAKKQYTGEDAHSASSPPTPFNNAPASPYSVTTVPGILNKRADSMFPLPQGRAANIPYTTQNYLSRARGYAAHGGPGIPRRAGEVRARSLAEVTGEKDIFVKLHVEFSFLLRWATCKFPRRPVLQGNLVTFMSGVSPMGASMSSQDAGVDGSTPAAAAAAAKITADGAGDNDRKRADSAGAQTNTASSIDSQCDDDDARASGNRGMLDSHDSAVVLTRVTTSVSANEACLPTSSSPPASSTSNEPGQKPARLSRLASFASRHILA